MNHVQRALEEELQSELNASIAGNIISISEAGICVYPGGIQIQVESLATVGWIERRERMIQEVVSREAKLNFLRLTEYEVLEQRQVIVFERGSLHVRHDE